MDLLISILFHGVASARILYIIAIGLSVTMGLMGFIKLAHGVFAMAGGYAAIWLMQRAEVPFAAAVPVAAVGIAILSIPVERLLTTAMSEPRLRIPERLAYYESRVPLGRVGEPEDLVGAAVFLASEESAYVTGTSLYVDGGYLAQ